MIEILGPNFMKRALKSYDLHEQQSLGKVRLRDLVGIPIFTEGSPKSQRMKVGTRGPQNFITPVLAVASQARPPLAFLRATLKSWEWPGLRGYTCRTLLMMHCEPHIMFTR